MWERLNDTWLPRVLFLSTLGLAALLGSAVFAAPWLRSAVEPAPLLLRLFADDPAVRRTSLASVVALTATAFIFFRPGVTLRKKKPSPKPPSSGNMAGA